MHFSGLVLQAGFPEALPYIRELAVTLGLIAVCGTGGTVTSGISNIYNLYLSS